MNTYEKLLDEAHKNGISIDENSKMLLNNEDGYFIETPRGDVILLNCNLETTIERKCTLAEELGHYYTTHGDITDQTKVENRKQELRARRWGYECLVPIRKLIQAYKYGCRSRYEVAKYIEVTEEFLEETITYYLHKYGVCKQIDKYIVYFSPFGIMESFD